MKLLLKLIAIAVPTCAIALVSMSTAADKSLPRPVSPHPVTAAEFANRENCELWGYRISLEEATTKKQHAVHSGFSRFDSQLVLAPPVSTEREPFGLTIQALGQRDGQWVVLFDVTKRSNHKKSTVGHSSWESENLRFMKQVTLGTETTVDLSDWSRINDDTPLVLSILIDHVKPMSDK